MSSQSVCNIWNKIDSSQQPISALRHLLTTFHYVKNTANLAQRSGVWIPWATILPPPTSLALRALTVSLQMLLPAFSDPRTKYSTPIQVHTIQRRPTPFSGLLLFQSEPTIFVCSTCDFSCATLLGEVELSFCVPEDRFFERPGHFSDSTKWPLSVPEEILLYATKTKVKLILRSNWKNIYYVNNTLTWKAVGNFVPKSNLLQENWVTVTFLWLRHFHEFDSFSPSGENELASLKHH